MMFGVAVGNGLQGVPFHFTDDLHTICEGAWYMKFIGLLDPFPLLAGVVSLAMPVMHGGAWLTLKAGGPVQQCGRAIGSVAALVVVGGHVLAGLWLAFGIEGYRIVGDHVTNGPSNPLHFQVERKASWLSAHADRPWIVVAPVLGILGGVLTFLGLRKGREVSTLMFSNMAIPGVTSSAGLTMFPFILPSSSDPRASLTVWNRSWSHLTLFIMLVVSAIFMPLILMYTAWVCKVLWGKVTAADVSEDTHPVYWKMFVFRFVATETQSPSASSGRSTDPEGTLPTKRLASLCCALTPAGPALAADLSNAGRDADLLALDDEYHAEAVYAATLAAFGDVRPLSNIIEAERRHQAALPGMMETSGIPAPADARLTGEKPLGALPATLAEVCAVGVEAEADNARLHDENLLLPVAGHADIIRVFTGLRDASIDDHLPAFERCAAGGGQGKGHSKGKGQNNG